MTSTIPDFLILVFETDTAPLDEIFDFGPIPPKERRRDAPTTPRECRNGPCCGSASCQGDKPQPDPFGDGLAEGLFVTEGSRLSGSCA